MNASLTSESSLPANPSRLGGDSFLVHLPMLAIVLILLATGLAGVDFGEHWDEWPNTLAPVERTLETGTALPWRYKYGSVNYFLALVSMAPDVGRWAFQRLRETPCEYDNLSALLEERPAELARTKSYLLRARSVFMALSSLAPLLTYMLVFRWRRSWLEAFLAGSFVALSWEFAYQSRFVVPDAIVCTFAALTLWLALSYVRNPNRPSFLRAAAICAAITFSTKVTCVFIILPVLVAACVHREPGTPFPRRAVWRLLGLFMASYLVLNPGIILQFPWFAQDAMDCFCTYSVWGLEGNTVNRGLDALGRIMVYLGGALFSPYVPIALALFALAIVGAWAMLRESRSTAFVLLVFPVAHVAFFAIQTAIIVRNLLVVIPFLAILAARGAMSLRPLIGRFAHGLLVTGLLACMALNASWLVSCALSIARYSPEHTVQQALHYIAGHPGSQYFVSEEVRKTFANQSNPMPANITSAPEKADYVVFFKWEKFDLWTPALGPLLNVRWFGSGEVNLCYYPGWIEGHNILIMGSSQARRYINNEMFLR